MRCRECKPACEVGLTAGPFGPQYSRKTAVPSKARRHSLEEALAGRDLSEVAERPRHEPRLAGWNERPPAVEPEGRAGCVGRKGTEPGATEVAVVARQLIRLAQFSPLPRVRAAVTTGDTTKAASAGKAIADEN